MNGKTGYLVYGLHVIPPILERSSQRILELWVDSSRHDERIQAILRLAQSLGIAVQKADRKRLDSMVGDSSHQGVVARVRSPHTGNEKELLDAITNLEHPPLLLVLDGVQDPHNLGACLRTADAAGVDAVIVPRDKACGLTATVSKVASGAAEVIPFFAVTNLARCLRELQQQGIWCIGLAGEAPTSLFDIKLSGPLAIVMGAEGKGLRRLTRETCDELAHLPMLGSVSSLNVSVSTGVALFEAVRQRAFALK